MRAVHVAVLLVMAGCVDPGAPKPDEDAALDDTAGPEETGCIDRAWHVDADGDGFGAGTPVTACTAPAGTVAEGGDCDDTDPAVHPGAPEHCDGVDEDCDGETDEDPVDPRQWWADEDGDGHGGALLEACTRPEGALDAEAGSTDCDDTDPAVYPGAPELCDEVDQDCDGALGFDAVATAAGPSLQELVDATPDGGRVCLPAGSWDGPVVLADRALAVVGAGADQTTLRASADGPAVAISGESAVELADLALGGTEEGGGELLVVEGGTVEGAGLALRGLDAAPDISPVRVVAGTVTVAGLQLQDLTLVDRPLLEQTGGVVELTALEGAGLALSAWHQGALVEVAGGELTLRDAVLRELQVQGPLVGVKDGATVTLARLRLTDSTLEVRDRGGVLQQYGGWLTADALVVAGSTFTGTGSFGARGALLYTGEVVASSTTLRNLSWVGNRAVADWLVEVKFPQTVAVIENSDFSDIGEDPSGAAGGATALALSHIAEVGGGSVQLALGWNNVEPEVELFYGGCGGTACDGVELGTVLREDPQYADRSAADAADWDLRLAPGSPLVDAGDPDCADVDGSRCDVGSHGGPEGAW